jgi:hypothetical protein
MLKNRSGRTGDSAFQLLLTCDMSLANMYSMMMYSVIHQYLFRAETIFEHLKYQLDQN